MLNNITLFKVGIKERLDPNWYRESGMGPTYNTRAHGQKERPFQIESADPYKRVATFTDISPREKQITDEEDDIPQLGEVRDVLEEPALSLASDKGFLSPTPINSFHLGSRDANSSGSCESKR